MTTAILVSSHGTVDRAEDIPAFLNNIRRGRPTPPELIAEVTHRFQQIGGSPLMATTRAQGQALAERLGLPVYVSSRLWHPYPKDVLQTIVADGVTHLLSLPLAPQSVDIYNAAVLEAAAHHPGLSVHAAASWGTEPRLIDAFAEAIHEALGTWQEAERRRVAVILSAHSLPMRVLRMGDPYETQFRQMADLVADRLRPHVARVDIAFQSQGATNDEWLGPDLRSTFQALFEAGVRDMVVAPIGFLADHVETLYDIDIEAQRWAKDMGFSKLVRMEGMNTRTSFVDALEVVARRELRALG